MTSRLFHGGYSYWQRAWILIFVPLTYHRITNINLVDIGVLFALMHWAYFHVLMFLFFLNVEKCCHFEVCFVVLLDNIKYASSWILWTEEAIYIYKNMSLHLHIYLCSVKCAYFKKKSMRIKCRSRFAMKSPGEGDVSKTGPRCLISILDHSDQ